MNNIKKFLNQKNILLFSFAFITSLLNCIGREFETGYLSENFSIYVFVIKIILFTILLYIVSSIIYTFSCKIKISNNNDISKSNEIFIISLFVIFIFWFIILLAYYPGLLVYDYWNQINMFETGITEHHPILHTLYLNFFYRLFSNLIGSKEVSILISTIIQMLLFDFSLSYLNLILYKININKSIVIFLILFEAVLPVFQVLSISHTKDIFFSAFFVLFVASNIEYNYLKDSFNLIIYILSIIGLVLSRNQAIYIFIIYMIIILIKNKSVNIKLNKITAYSIIISMLCLLLLRVFTGAKPGKKAEFVSVPAEAIARISILYIDDFDEYTKVVFGRIIKDGMQYDPFRSDGVKNYLALSDFDDFAYIVKKTIFRYPYEYLLSAYLLDIGYLYINDTHHAHIYKISDPNEYRSIGGYFMTSNESGYESKFPALERVYEDLFAHEEYQKLFIIRYLFSPALYFYILLYSMILSIVNHKKELVDIYVFIVLFIGTMLLGPCTLIRYALPYISITFPMFFISIKK